MPTDAISARAATPPPTPSPTAAVVERPPAFPVFSFWFVCGTSVLDAVAWDAPSAVLLMDTATDSAGAIPVPSVSSVSLACGTTVSDAAGGGINGGTSIELVAIEDPPAASEDDDEGCDVVVCCGAVVCCGLSLLWKLIWIMGAKRLNAVIEALASGIV